MGANDVERVHLQEQIVEADLWKRFESQKKERIGWGVPQPKSRRAFGCSLFAKLDAALLYYSRNAYATRGQLEQEN